MSKLLSFILSLLMVSLSLWAPPESAKPNVILIMSDDQGWGQVGYVNHPHLKGKTPNLDAMAKPDWKAPDSNRKSPAERRAEKKKEEK